MMEFKPQIQSQYHASLEMLKQLLEKFPEERWNQVSDQNRAWQIAYHALFYTHLYLHIREEDFQPWPKHRREARSLSPAEDGQAPNAFSKAEVLEFLEYVDQRVDELVDALDLEAESGFYWLPFDKLELQFYNIRHLMLHTGELAERLWTATGQETDWVSMRGETT
ncbi:MAG: DinB family protein [Anaerolineales bacterium]